MDRFDSLTAFTRVVEEGGFASAARSLGRSRSQVSKLVIALEERLQVQLFNRTTRTVAATPAGLAFYERAKAVLTDLAEAETALSDNQDEPRGELKINAPMSFGTRHLGPAIADFMARHPDLRVQLMLDDRFVDPIADGFDITVRIAEPVDAPSLIDHDIVVARRVICASPAFLERVGEPTTVGALSDLPCLHYGDLRHGSSWRLIGPEGAVEVRVQGVMCSNNAEVLRDAAVEGLGVAVLPTFIAGPEQQTGQLTRILPDYAPPEIRLQLLYAPHRHLSARTRRFVEFFYERFGDRPQWDLVE